MRAWLRTQLEKRQNGCLDDHKTCESKSGLYYYLTVVIGKIMLPRNNNELDFVY